MTTLTLDTIVNQSEARFRNEIMRAYFSAGEVDELSVTTRTLNYDPTANNGAGAPDTAVIEFKRLLVLSFTGSMLILLENTQGGQFEFVQRNGTLVLPTSGRVTLTASGTSVNPRAVKYVAI